MIDLQTVLLVYLFLSTKTHHVFGSLVLFWNGIFHHSVKSSEVRILIIIRNPIHLRTQIHFLVCTGYNCRYNYCSRWRACVACINWLALLLGNEAERSSGWANILSILSVSCTAFAVFQVTCCQCYSATKRKSNSYGLFIRTFLLQFSRILNGVQNRYSFKLSDCHKWIRHVIIKLYLHSASSFTSFYFHLLTAVTATWQVFP